VIFIYIDISYQYNLFFHNPAKATQGHANLKNPGKKKPLPREGEVAAGTLKTLKQPGGGNLFEPLKK